MKRLALIALLLCGCQQGPTCEERGGKIETTTILQPMIIGHAIILMPTTFYNCREAK